MSYILDTCVISEMVKPSPHRNVLEWMGQQNEDVLYLSVLTIGEIQKGISRLPDNLKKTNLQSWLDIDLKCRFENRLLPIDEEVSKIWGTIQAMAEKSGRKIPVIDSLIAATGLVHQMAVVTRNSSDMPSLPGLTIFNPWEG